MSANVVVGELSSRVWTPVRTANSTATSFPSKIPTTTQPSGTGVIPMGHDGYMTTKCLLILPYGVGSSTNTMLLKCLGWAPTGVGPTLPLWIPTVIGAWTATLGTATGVAGSDLDNTQLFATTIVPSLGPTLINTAAPNTVPPIIPDYGVFSPGSNDIGLIIQRSFGFRFLELIMTTNNSATSVNALYRIM